MCSKSSVLKRQLGRDGPLVSRIGLGCLGMSDFYGGSDEKTSLEVLNRALDLGCSFWDTSDMYGPHENEKLLSKVLEKRRDEVFLCTKFGVVRDPKYGEEWSLRSDKEYVKQACADSLERLKVKTIDLYYQHRVDPKTPIEETVGALAELVKEGKVRYIGLSECNAETLRKAYAIHPITALQIEYSPWETGIEANGLLKTCRELGVAIVCYSPLGRGFLAGALKNIDSLPDTDFRKQSFPKTSKENFDHNLKLVKRLEDIAVSKKATPSQLCLRWILEQGDDFFPIPGTRRVKYLEENLDSLNIAMSKDEEAQIRTLVSECQIKGERYSKEHLASIQQ